jgi:hypothetical protein
MSEQFRIRDPVAPTRQSMQAGERGELDPSASSSPPAEARAAAERLAEERA